MPKLKFADDLPQPASVNAPLQCQICFESPAETAAEATPEEPSLFAECDNTNERDQQAAPQQQAHCPPAKTALSDHGRQRYSLEKKREASNNKLVNIFKEKNANENQIESIENRVSKILIEPGYREKILHAFTKSEEYVEIYKITASIFVSIYFSFNCLISSFVRQR